ncbi:MAG: regulatory protein LuxR [Marmoricola sp.]|nr:regulatory protein LuxR [Marmoricola sp.]
MAGIRPVHTTTELDEGVGAPVLSLVPVIMGGVPLPEFPADVRELIGRESELDELASALGVRSGPAALQRAVLLSGDAGVGKTRLLTELRDVAFDAGWQVVAGHCLDFGDSALPYLPFSEVMGRLLTAEPELLEEIAGRRPVLRALQPGRRTMQGSERDTAAAVGRGDLFDAVHALLDEVATTAPLLLVIEDVHWADTSTRDLIRFLFSRPFDNQVAIVASYRSDDLHRRHPLRRATAEWARMPGVARMQLEPLGPGAVRSLVKQLHPEPMRESEVAGIVARAEGNAFFVEELVGAASAMGQAVPDDLADLLLVRLDRLTEAAQQTVRAASVSGRRVSHGLLAEVAGVAANELESALREAVELNILVPTSNDFYRFRHALLAEAVYGDLLPGERVRMHAAYVDALASGRANGTAAELARHARAAHDLPTAVNASIRAGDEAMSVGGPDEAADHFQTALELLADPAAQTEIVDIGYLGHRVAEALIASGRPGRAIMVVRELLQGLAPDWPPEQRGRLLVAMATAVMVDETRLDPLEFTAEALTLVPDEPSRLRATVLAAHARAHAFNDNVDAAREFGAEALTLAESQDLPRLATDVITTLAGLGAKGSEDVRSGLEEAVRRAQETGAGGAELRSLYLLGRWHQDRAAFGPAVEMFDRAVTRAAELGQPWAPFAFDSRLLQAQIATITADYDEALRLADVSGQAPPAIPETLLAAIVTTVKAVRGDQSVLAVLPQLRSHWTKDGLIPITVGPAVIELRSQSGDLDGVIAEHDAVVDAVTTLWREFFHARVRLGAVTLGALASGVGELSIAERERFAAIGDRVIEGSRRTLTLQAEEATHWGPEGIAWAARLSAEHLRFRWLLGIDPPGESELVEAWERALEAVTEFGHRWEIARTQTRLAAVLQAAGDQPRARALADAARAEAKRMGAEPLLAELRGLGNAPRQRANTASETLTARESEILTLVAQGRSNGEIGKQLFIATKTVSVHVSNILGKLGASSRTEAAAIGRRKGLL